MKRWMIIALCLALCFALGCGKGTTEQGETPHPDIPEETISTPAAETTPANTVEPHETPNPTEEPTDDFRDAELPPMGGVDSAEYVPDLHFEAVTVLGEPIDSGIFKNYDLVIVNFWADWCGPCVGEIPDLERIHQEYPNVLILGVLVDSSDEAGAKAVMNDAGVTYPVLYASGSLEKYENRVLAIPMTFFFDNEGDEVDEPIVGAHSYEQWKSIIDSLLP